MIKINFKLKINIVKKINKKTIKKNEMSFQGILFKF